jgi:hypothetical protein
MVVGRCHHRVCYFCWSLMPNGTRANAADSIDAERPINTRGAETLKHYPCCFCGLPTRSGIFLYRPPGVMDCEYLAPDHGMFPRMSRV